MSPPKKTVGVYERPASHPRSRALWLSALVVIALIALAFIALR